MTGALDSIWHAVNSFRGQPIFTISRLSFNQADNSVGVWALLKNGAVIGRVYDEDLAKRIVKELNK